MLIETFGTSCLEWITLRAMHWACSFLPALSFLTRGVPSTSPMTLASGSLPLTTRKGALVSFVMISSWSELRHDLLMSQLCHDLLMRRDDNNDDDNNRSVKLYFPITRSLSLSLACNSVCRNQFCMGHCCVAFEFAVYHYFHCLGLSMLCWDVRFHLFKVPASIA